MADGFGGAVQGPACGGASLRGLFSRYLWKEDGLETTYGNQRFFSELPAELLDPSFFVELSARILLVIFVISCTGLNGHVSFERRGQLFAQWPLRLFCHSPFEFPAGLGIKSQGSTGQVNQEGAA